MLFTRQKRWYPSGMTESNNEQNLRRERSLSYLRRHDVPYIEHLPNIDAEADTTRRRAHDVGLRVLCLALISMKGAGADHDFVLEGALHYDVMQDFSPLERRFLLDKQPTENEKLQFSWCVEAAHALLWSVQQIDSLTYPAGPCDWNAFWEGFHRDGRAPFLERLNLREQSVILDEADLIFRLHWASKDADLNGRAQPAKLNRSVVMERHKGLNWLTAPADEPYLWDDVPTDT